MKPLSLKSSIVSLLTALTSATALAATQTPSHNALPLLKNSLASTIKIDVLDVGDINNLPDSPPQTLGTLKVKDKVKSKVVATASTDANGNSTTIYNTNSVTNIILKPTTNTVTLVGYGAVDTEFLIGKTDITADQYCVFLNAVAKQSDPYGLYNTNMTSDANTASISVTTNVDGTFTYTPISGREKLPIVYVTWFSAARFCNWLNNGQPTLGEESAATTETGSYNLNGATNDIAGDINTPANDYCVPTEGAKYLIPTEDQWIKAAYYKRSADAAAYWDYPTMTMRSPSFALYDSTNAATQAVTLGYLSSYRNYNQAVNTLANLKQLNTAKSNADAALASVDTNDVTAYQQAVSDDQTAIHNLSTLEEALAASDFATACTKASNNITAAAAALANVQDANAPGNQVSAKTNSANYFIPFASSQYTTANAPRLTSVGAFAGSSGPYGTFDMGGLVYQWTSRPYNRLPNQNPGSRLIGGGSWKYDQVPDALDRRTHVTYDPSVPSASIGFRIVAPASTTNDFGINLISTK